MAKKKVKKNIESVQIIYESKLQKIEAIFSISFLQCVWSTYLDNIDIECVSLESYIQSLERIYYDIYLSNNSCNVEEHLVQDDLSIINSSDMVWDISSELKYRLLKFQDVKEDIPSGLFQNLYELYLNMQNRYLINTEQERDPKMLQSRVKVLDSLWSGTQRNMVNKQVADVIQTAWLKDIDKTLLPQIIEIEDNEELK